MMIHFAWQNLTALISVVDYRRFGANRQPPNTARRGTLAELTFDSSNKTATTTTPGGIEHIERLNSHCCHYPRLPDVLRTSRPSKKNDALNPFAFSTSFLTLPYVLCRLASPISPSFSHSSTMTDLRALEGLQALHGELVAVRQHRLDNLQTLEALLEAHTEAFKKLLDKPSRNSANRTSLGSNKIVKTADAEYKVNDEFVNETLKVADDLDLDEFEAGRILLDCVAEGDPESQSRPLWDCGVIRFHQERRFLLDCMRLCIEISDDEELDEALRDAFGAAVEDKIFGVPRAGPTNSGAPSKRIVQRCMEAMQNVKAMLHNIVERAAARNLLEQVNLMKAPEGQETFEFSKSSLVEQHECLSVILHAAVEKRQADVNDFKQFLESLKQIEKYDQFLGKLGPLPSPL